MIKLTRQVFPDFIRYSLKQQQFGHIISLLPLSFPDKMVPYNGVILTPYYATKFGEAGMTEALKLEAKQYGVAVTSLYLGAVASHVDIDQPEEQAFPNIHVKTVITTVSKLIQQEQKLPTVILEAKSK